MDDQFYDVSLDYEQFIDSDPYPKALDSDKKIDNDAELNERDRAYTLLLNRFVNTYSNNQIKKHQKKWEFYRLIVIMFIALIVLVLFGVYIICSNFRYDKITLLTTFVTAFAGLFTTLITLPNTIAKYLFNPKEDEVISKVVIEMQKQDVINRRINHQIEQAPQNNQPRGEGKRE